MTVNFTCMVRQPLLVGPVRDERQVSIKDAEHIRVGRGSSYLLGFASIALVVLSSPQFPCAAVIVASHDAGGRVRVVVVPLPVQAVLVPPPEDAQRDAGDLETEDEQVHGEGPVLAHGLERHEIKICTRIIWSTYRLREKIFCYPI